MIISLSKVGRGRSGRAKRPIVAADASVIVVVVSIYLSGLVHIDESWNSWYRIIADSVLDTCNSRYTIHILE